MDVRKLLRSNLWLYERVRQYRSKSTDSQYQKIRDRYYCDTKGLFKEPGYLLKSRQLLSSYWSGPSAVKYQSSDVRIFVVFATVAGAACWYRAISHTFDVVWVDHAEFNRRMEQGDPKARHAFQAVLLDKFHKAHNEKPIDLVWMHAYRSHIDPETLDVIRATGVPVALHSLDDKHAFVEDADRGFPNGIQPLIKHVDIHLTNSIETVRWAMAEGTASYFMPQGIEPEIFKPQPTQKNIDVSFIGSAYGMRRLFIDKLVKAGINVLCFGRGWKSPRLNGERQIDIYNRSWLNLGIGGVASSERITCIKGRDMSVPGSGNVLLTLYDAELAKMWHIGKEVLCYFNEIDCIDMIRYYLERPDDLISIGRAARVRALEEHTWTERIRHLLMWLGILVAGRTDKLESFDDSQVR